jgi:hypothetical protein
MAKEKDATYRFPTIEVVGSAESFVQGKNLIEPL